MLHNAALLVIQQKINDGDIVPGEDLASNISQYSNAVRDWICELGYDCRTVDQVRVKSSRNSKAVQAIPEGTEFERSEGTSQWSNYQTGLLLISRQQ